jgi:hypothetical protein
MNEFNRAESAGDGGHGRDFDRDDAFQRTLPSWGHRTSRLPRRVVT